MKFDQWWDMADGGGDQVMQTADLPLVPDGEHVAKVVKAEWKELKFKKSDRNPAGLSLVIELEVTGYKLIERIVDVTWRGMIEAICRAASVPVPTASDDWDCRGLVGQFVRIECLQGVGSTGREYVKVTRFVPGPEPLPEAIRKTPPRKAAAKPQIHTPPEDDIPF